MSNCYENRSGNGYRFSWKEGTWVDYSRVNECVDIFKSLLPGLFLVKQYNPLHWIQFKHESILDFCYHYGRLDNERKDCKQEKVSIIQAPSSL